MFRSLSQQILFKAVPRPLIRLPNGILCVISSQSNVDVGNAGTEGSLQFWLNHAKNERTELLDQAKKERTELREQLEKEKMELLNRFEKERCEYTTLIKGCLLDIEGKKRYN